MNTKLATASVTLVWALLGAFVVPARGSGPSEQIAHGQILWGERIITVTGSAAPSPKAANAAEARLGAERAARLDAWRNILEAVKGVTLSSSQTVGASLDASPQIMAKVQGVLRNFKVLDTKYYSDGGVDVVVSMPLDGVLLTTVAPQQATSTIASEGEAEYTGLIVQAKGIGAKPALLPRILDQSGAEIFAAHMLDPQAYQRHGVAGYANDTKSAIEHERTGKKPLVISASSSSGQQNTDLVLADADASKLRATNLSFLAQGKVMIVID